jgi:hypothetical protein
MKQLDLNVRQRLNVTALLGQQKGNIAQIRLACRIIDKVELTPAEREAVDCQADGATIRWSPAKEVSVPARRIELEDQEARYLESVLNGWPGFAPSDIQWLEPLLAALGPELTRVNQAGPGRQ